VIPKGSRVWLHTPAILTAEWKAEKEKWLDDLYQAEKQNYVAIPIQPTKFEIIPSTDVRPELDAEPVYAEYFGGESDDNAPSAWSEFPPEDCGNLEWIYVVDLDRDAFSIDLRAHFRLSNLHPDWMDHVELDEEGHRRMPTRLGPEYLAENVFVTVPDRDRALLEVYKTLEVTEMEPPMPAPDQCEYHAQIVWFGFHVGQQSSVDMAGIWSRRYSHAKGHLCVGQDLLLGIPLL
jgi:hypothetical protein